LGILFWILFFWLGVGNQFALSPSMFIPEQTQTSTRTLDYVDPRVLLVVECDEVYAGYVIRDETIGNERYHLATG
jgi:hypothetical protein